MKQIFFVALPLAIVELVLLVLGAARMAKADGNLDFSDKIARVEKQVVEPKTPSTERTRSLVLDFAPPLPVETATRVEVSLSKSRALIKPVAIVSGVASEGTVTIDLFEGGSDSLVARAVGSAEGTRTPEGGKTRAYYGHTDPGNGRWNQGSFSYQHEARSPEEADSRQLRRLQVQANLMRSRAGTNRLMWSLEAELNGIDLANQAPLAALDRGGYVDRLRQAYDRGFKGSDAVLQARIYSFLDPRTNQWDAPGLGNSESSITHDQGRRLDAIAQALSVHQQALAKQSRLVKTASRNASAREPKHRLASPGAVEVSKLLDSDSTTPN